MKMRHKWIALLMALMLCAAAFTPGFAQTVEQYEQEAAAGNAEAMVQLAGCYYYGEGVEQDYEQAIEWLHKAVDAGNATAMYNLGYCYYTGHGVEQDCGKAAEWFEKAANAGLADAMNALGYCYYIGQGVERNYAQAVEWYRKAIEAGNVEAMVNLAVCYENGQGVEQDYAQAVEWTRKAVETGHAIAMNTLGYYYENGYGVEQDYAQAAEWYQRAVEAGNATALNNLGRCYFYGYGVEQDQELALELIHLGAEAGDLIAMGNLGYCYENGEGVEQDYEQALLWYQREVDAGYKAAEQDVARVEELLAAQGGAVPDEGDSTSEDAGESMVRVLKKGMEGDDVKVMQERLMQLGYALPEHGANGNFNQETREALQEFQKDEGLEVDGVYGEKSHAALLDAYTSFQLEKAAASTPGPVTLPSTEWEWVLEPFIEADDIQPVASVYVLLESGDWGQGESGHIQKEMALWVDGKVGLIDYEGNVLIEPLYEDLYYYARYDMYMLKASGRDYAYIDNQVQEVDIQNYAFGYDEYGGEGLSEYFYWDDDLKHVMCIATEGGPSYTHNMEIVREGWFDNNPYGKYGLAKENQILIPIQFEYGFHTMGAAYDYSHDFYNAKEAYIFWDGEAWTYYDADGQMIIANCDEAWLNSEEDRIYRYAGAKPPFNFSEGMLAFGQDGKWGYCDEEGQIKIPQVFEATRPVSPTGLAWVKQGGKWGVIRALPRFATEQFMCTLLEDGSVRIEEYKGTESTVQVPSVLAGCNVSEIGKQAFLDCEMLQRVELPEGVTVIGDGAFGECHSLIRIELPEKLTTVGDKAFYMCESLDGVELPEGLTTIGDEAFSGCVSLSSVELPGGLMAIGDSTFSWCDSLRSIELPEGLTTIGDGAFSGCDSLLSIELPEGLTTIGDEAFFACYSLSGVTIPASVTEIGENAFLSCNALILAVEQGSYAHEYAETYDIPYTYLEVPDWLMD